MRTKIHKYYSNGKLESYFKTEDTQYFTITLGFTGHGLLFNVVVIYKNQFGRPYAQYEKVDDEPGFYRRINSEGALSIKDFDRFGDCIKYHGEKLI